MTGLEWPAHLHLLVIAGFAGGLIRGYSGFGFALAAVPILSIGIAPAAVVPTVVLLELVYGGLAIRSVRASLHRLTFSGLAIGSLAGTPLGLLFLRGVPPEPMRIVVAVVVLASVAIIAIGNRRLRIAANPAALLGAGFASGLMNGGTAMSGPPAILTVLGSELDARIARATLIVFIVFSAALALAISALLGLVGRETFTNALAMAVPVGVGTLLGIRLFRVMPEALYRVVSLAILSGIALVTLVATLGGG